MGSTNNPNSPPSTQSRTTPYNVPDAALRGAILAFAAKPPVKSKPVNNVVSSSNGRSQSVSPNRFAGRLEKTQSLYETRADKPGFSMSPSMTAASLAAARYSPMASGSPFSTGREHISEPRSTSKWMESASEGDSHFALKGRLKTKLQEEEPATDSTSIAPTTSLVQLFEQNSKNDTSSAGPKQTATNHMLPTKAKPPLIVSPKPQRSIPIHYVSEELERPPGRLHVRTLSDVNHDKIEKATAPVTRRKSDEDITASKPTIPPPRRAAKRQQEKALEPLKSPPKQPKVPSIHTDTHTTPSTLVDRPPLSVPDTPVNFSTSPSPKPYLTSSYKDASLKQISPHITGDRLANAIVGAHLAASRQPTPSLTSSTKQPPRPPSPRRKNKYDHHSQHRHHHLVHHRSPSPTKREPGKLRHTLRQDISSEPEGDNGERQKGFNRLVKNHPHKHQEGTRKRWRDTITDRERKRYEGVWAANKGLYVQSSSASNSSEDAMRENRIGEDEVLNLVVRDVWLRSRLPAQVLEEVWSLVDRRGVGRLTKEEFVVGLWLIDQRLKGRKLPPRVGDSVWASVTGLGTRGVKVRLKDGGGRKKRFERQTDWL